MKGILLHQEDGLTQRRAQGHGYLVRVADDPALIADQTLIVGPEVGIPWNLLDAGWHFLERWEAASPLWRYGVLAKDVGTAEERERTRECTLDLRVPLYEPSLLFLRRSEGAEQLLAVWQAECAEGGNRRLAFLRALCQVKPLFLALPRSWMVEPALYEQPRQVAQPDPQKPGLVLVEVGPKRFIRCHPEEAEIMRQRFSPQRRV